MKKRIISIILSIVMLISLLPVAVMAEEPDTLVLSCTCGASADADGVISHISDCPLYYNIAAVNEPEAADPECTCGAVPDEDGVTSHGEECPLYAGLEEEPEEKPAEELAAPAVLERTYDEETSSDTVLYVDGQWDAYCWEIYTDDTFEWAVYADTAEIVVDKETYVASAFRCTVTLGEQSAVTEPAAYNMELIEPTVSLWNTRTPSDRSDYMVWTKDDSVFNIRGLDGSYEFQTTFMDKGYRSWIEVDGTSREGTGGQLRDGLTYDITPSLVYGGRYVKITYTVVNTGSKTYTFRVGSAADVMIDNNDKAPVVGLTGGGGLKMSGSPKNKYTFNLVAPSADTLWYGYWRTAGKNVFNDREDKNSVYDKDSGMAWSWKDEVIKPGQTWERSVLIGVGELPVTTNMPHIPSMPEFVAGENGTISGTATPGDTVYVTVDGEEYSDTADEEGKFSMDVPIPAEQPDDTLDVTYYAVSPEGGISGITSVQVSVAAAPRITLRQSELTLMEEDATPDFNSFISDSEGNVSITSAAVNTDIPGTYTVTYTASVGGFDPATAYLTVTVVPKPAELTAASCTEGSTSFTLTATMKYTGGNTYTETGFVYAPYHYPTLTDNAGQVVTSSPVNIKGGALSASVADSALIYGVSYYARPYAKFGNAVIYGGESGNFGLGVPSYGSVQISNKGDNTFTVSRTGGSNGQQTVHFRTVNGSAVGGTHFTHQTGTVTIPDGETTAGTISIEELGVNQTYGGKAATGYSNADRTYQVEIYLVEGGASIGTGKATRTMTKNSGYVIDRTIYSEWKTQTKSAEVRRGDYDKDKLGWTENAQGSAAQETFKIADTPGFLQRDYWINTADAVKFQLQLSAKEAESGYQHIQITPGQSLDLNIYPYDGNWRGTQSTTLYVATFEHGGDKKNTSYVTYYFPKASGSNTYTPSETFYGTQNGTQYVRLPVSTEYVSIGYGGSGTGTDEWLTKDQYNRFMLKDTKEPQLLGIAPMADTTYVPGQQMTLALIFDEIVDQTNSAAAGLNSSIVLGVDWNNDNNADASFNYAGGLNTNVLYFTCTLPETMDITDECTLKLLSNSELSTKIKDMCNESVTSSAGYNDKTVTVQFNSTKPSVDIGPLSTDAAGFTSGTITASDFTKLEYVWSQDSSIPVAGWESVAGSVTTVKTRQTEGTWYLHARATNAYGRTATASAAITFAAGGSGGTPVVLPKLEVSVDNTTWVKEQRVISITTRQPSAATVAVTKPDGSKETVSGDSYTATTNGVYTFTLTSGIETITKMVNVARIDLNAPTVSIEDLTNFTHTAAVTLTVTAADTESGLAAAPLAGVWKKNGAEEVAATFTSAGDGVWTTISPDATGSWVLTVTATDAVGHIRSDSSGTYTIHAERPTITISNRQETDAGITYNYAVQENGNTDVTVTLPDGTTTTELTGTVLLTEPGSYYIFVTDALGHYVQSAEMTVPQSTTDNPVDYTAPDVRYETAPYLWTNADEVTVTLDIFEEQGLASVTYRKPSEATETVIDINGVVADADYTYTTRFTVTENGTYTVTAKDVKGNAGTMDVVVDFIDRTDPNVSFDGIFDQWRNAEQTITLRPADPDVDGDNEDASGVAKVEYAVSADKTTVPAALTVLENPYQVTISENGTWYIYYKITDNAGNVATGWSEAVKVDKETPVITVDTSAAMTGAGEQTVSVTATFGVSGGAVTVGGDTVLTMESTAQSGTYTEEKTNTYVIRAKGVYDFVAASAAGKTASQTVTVYGIDFDSNGGRNAGGNEVAGQIVVSGGKATAPETITRTGYTFGGWYKESDCTNKWDFESDVVTESITLYAKWTPADLTGTVSIGGDVQIGKTLTANVMGTNNTGTLSYQWYRGLENQEPISGATAQTYTITVGDAEYRLFCVVSSSVQTGSIGSAEEAVGPVPYLTFTEESVSVVGYTGNYDGQNHSIAVTAPEGASVEYSRDGEDWSETNPSFCAAGTYTIYYRVTKTGYESVSGSANVTISPKPVHEPTAALEYASIAYSGSERKPTVTLKDGDTEIPSGEYTVSYSNNVNVGTATVTITDKEYGNYTFAEITKTFEIMREGVSPVVTMGDYVYGGTPAVPSVSGNNGSGTVNVYYSTDSSRVDKLWEDVSGTTLNVGTYYMKVHVASTDNYAEGTSPVITFKVTPGKYAAPSAPTASEFTVTVNEADRDKILEYSLDGANWISVPVLTNGAFELKGLSESTRYTVYLRVKASANGNYQASDAVSTVWTTPARYSVAYHANLGTGNVPASVTQNSGRSVTVARGSGLKHTGYTFAGWNTAADGTGTDYAPGSTISTGATLYAKWTANSYTVKFKANGGSGTMGDQSFTYDTAQALNSSAFTRDGYHFAGWALSSGNTAIYMDGQTVKNLSDKGTITLHAVWAEEVYKIGADFASESNHSINAKLMRGDAQIGGEQSVTMSGTDAPYTGHFDFTDVPKGIYNIVAEQDGKVMTKLIIITNHDDTVEITMPASKVNSVLDVSEDALPVVVGGLEDEAVTKAEESKTVTITMTVEKQEEQQLPDNASEAEKATQEAIAEIKEEASGKTFEFMDIEVEKTVEEAGQAGVSEKLTETNKVMEIVIPFDLTGKMDIAVYRHHNGQTKQLAENTTKADGTFYIDAVNHLIHVFSRKFSTYAIGYTAPVVNPPSSGGDYAPTYAITVEDAENGDVKANRSYASSGTTVTITVTPEDGYVLKELSVVDSQNNKIEVTDKGDGTYTFKMPRRKVTVTASFVADGSFSACPKDNTCPIWPFTDAETTAWYHDGVHYCIENGLMAGYGDGIFKPNADTTRAMITVMLWRLNGSPVVNYLLDFEDVEEGKWYTEAIRWAKSEGIATGYGNGYFGTNDAVTREQMVTILWRYAQHKGYDVSVGENTNILSYDDAFDVAEYAIPAMQWACGSGMVQGMNDPDGEGMILAPASKGTRAQIATMIMRFCEEILK